MILTVVGGRKFEEEFIVDADKSISHRCAIFSLLTNGKNTIKNYLRAEDTMNSLEIAKALGAKVEDDGETITIQAPKTLQEAEDVLYCGNSGTTIRIYMGLLAGIDGFFVLTGDQYLRRRPMKRVAEPLRSIGAKIDGRKNGDLAPLAVRGGKLKSFNYVSKIASAQVKSAMILAALNADKPSYYEEPMLSRDHTERMLKGMGAKLECIMENGKWKVKIYPLEKKLEPLNIEVPNDPSSAFFFAVAAAITDSTAIIKNVTLNPTRIEAYKALERMGADIEYVLKEDKYEPIGDIIVKGAKLSAIEVSDNIPWLIDELPALAMAMAVAEGKSVVKNAKELRVKESDRISTVINGLKACGIEAKEFEDGYEITGGIPKKAKIDSHGDHRIAMSFAVLGLLCGMEIEKAESINTSFPNFFKLFEKIADFKVNDDN
ncbi:3-phosphoshikimate 1-carboxyvinyltransferase [Nautilia profundicola AmH]|uniref:3-phosphoshikimate 1-carboxyvinyltransferase n=1 Tax=Nautilia profundicola (strain ATCC BAA-1463 / DSM 18972 / AmH) TaxID=598659 RepID=B9L9K4_NAUPA|nr:3-phosphoshikimate 1-carboxyvinyltransferase [Nautilia profundicola]ACM92625.1 3-phosphoshikimate 1-carboxyvinyltransferase [Nautilia profundicola AmH]